MPTPTNPLWDAHLSRLRQTYGRSGRTAAGSAARRTAIAARDDGDARRGEWSARPPGRLGRRLLADVEPYVEFFAIARTSSAESSRAQHSS